MFSLSAVMLACHYSLVAILCLYGSHRIYHTWLARMTRKTSALAPSDDRPFVTVQAPMFNEKFVAERIIDALAGLNYPKEKLQIQVIDDSNDDSAQLIARRVAHYKALGFNIQHLHRTNRQGYKAGALAEAMDQVSGEFIAIFDAEHISAWSKSQGLRPMRCLILTAQRAFGANQRSWNPAAGGRIR